MSPKATETSNAADLASDAPTFLNEITLFESSDEERATLTISKNSVGVNTENTVSALPEMSLATPLPTSDSGSEEKADDEDAVDMDSVDNDHVKVTVIEDHEEDEEDAPWQEGDDEADMTLDVSVYVSDSEDAANQTLALQDEALDLLQDLDAEEKSLPALAEIKDDIEKIQKKKSEQSDKKTHSISLLPAIFSRKRKRSLEDEDEEQDIQEETKDSEGFSAEPSAETSAPVTVEKAEDAESSADFALEEENARPTKRIRKAIGRFSTFAIGAAAGSAVTIAALLASAPPLQ